jgi:ribosomal protein RSM22 (predicted rRNA methylase)
MNLPPELSSAISHWLAGHGGGARRDGARAITQSYRQGGSSRGIDFGAYLVARLPATHAAVSAALDALAQQRPGFTPQSLLDVGSGPGTASWAAVERWPGISSVAFLDNDPDFLALAGELAGRGPLALASARRVSASVTALPQDVEADLVIAAYALAELPLPQAADMWRAAKQALVLVEPGTPTGFARIAAARTELLKRGAVPVAPCPHAEACPMAAGDWCHASVRLARSRAHMHAKGAELPFEDEKFSYLAVTRGGAVSGGSRILSPPRHLKHAVTFRLCTQGRLEERLIARRDAGHYKAVRHKNWGDWIGPAEEETP